MYQEEQLKVKDKHEAEVLQRQSQLEEAERHRKASEALRRAELVRQRRLLKVSQIDNILQGPTDSHVQYFRWPMSWGMPRFLQMVQRRPCSKPNVCNTGAVQSLCTSKWHHGVVLSVLEQEACIFNAFPD